MDDNDDELVKALELDAAAWRGPKAKTYSDMVRAVDTKLEKEGFTDPNLRSTVIKGLAATRASKSYLDGLESRFDADSAFEGLQAGPLGWLIQPKKQSGLTAEEHRQIASKLPPAERMNYARKHGLM